MSSTKPKKSHKHKDKSKHKEKHSSGQPSSIQTPHGKNEGSNTELAYQPPPGAILANHLNDAGDFDWDAIRDNDEGLELWIVRVPNGLKPKHLEDVTLDAPTSSMTARIGSIERKTASYDVWNLGEDVGGEVVGGEELKALSCLLPRSKKHGKLYLAPPMTTRHLVISTKSSLPTPDPSSDSDMPYQAIHQNPPRHSYPREILKHRFMPTGSLALTGEEESTITVDSNEMNVDATVSEVPASSLKKISKKTKDEEGSGESKSKKRKGEAASPTKRSKVTKTAS